MATLLAVLVFIGFVLSSLYNYLLFHTLAELFSILIAYGIFVIAWNSQRFEENNYLLFLGIAYLFVGSIDLVHTLTYKGMNIFEDHGANLPTQLWISARYMESLSLFLALIFVTRKMNARLVILAFAGVTSLLFIDLFSWRNFPACFAEGQGLTPFKKISEYLICLILLGSLILLHRRRAHFDRGVFRLIVWSILSTIWAELFFTFYISVYGISNLVGHFFKLVSFYLIYKAVIETGLSRPHELLWRNLQQSEESLRQERNALQKALSDLKVLRGLLPICSACKKIRDDKGYWNQIESYIRDRSEAEFSHGICPECAGKLYPDLYKDKSSE